MTVSVLRDYTKPPESNFLRPCLTKGTFSPCDEWPLLWKRHLVTEPELVVKGNDIPYCHEFHAVGSVVWYCLLCGSANETHGLMHADKCSTNEPHPALILSSVPGTYQFIEPANKLLTLHPGPLLFYFWLLYLYISLCKQKYSVCKEIPFPDSIFRDSKLL